MKTFIFETTEEMKDCLLGKDYDISFEVVNTALNNLNLKEGEEVDIMEFITEDSDLTYEVGIAQEDLKDTLEVNLKIMEHHEDYEICQKIIEAIKYLESNE